MTSLHLVRLVGGREIRDRLRSRAFLITTALSMLVIVALVVAPALLGDDEPAPLDLGVLATADLPASFAASAEALAPAFDHASVELVDLPDRAAAEAALAGGEVQGVVLDPGRVLVEEPGTPLDEFVSQALQGADMADFLAREGLDPADLEAAMTPPEVAVVTPDGQDAGQRETQAVIGLAITVLLFLTLQMNGQSILTTTVEEKSSRVVEVLLGVLRPWQLLGGKLAAMAVLSIGQLLLYAGAGVGAAVAVDRVDLPDTTAMTLVAGIAMFVVGFALYAAVYAVAGSLAGSSEEAQSAAGPIGFLSVAVYVSVIIAVVPNPDGTAARVLTWIPFSAPFAVPVRATAGLAAWEAVGAFVVTALTMVLVVRLAGRLYSAAVLSGGRMSWRDAFRAEPIR